jgi:predicted metalloprotease with PDZ domain
MNRSVLAVLASAILVSCAQAQTAPQPQPEPVPMPTPVVAPVDKPYIGPIKLTVDARNFVDRVEKVHEEIPVVPGSKEMVLLYPEWIPGEHAPSGPIANLAGIITTVDGKRVLWTRNNTNVYAFHVPLPAGAKTVGLDFDYLTAIKSHVGRIEFSDKIIDFKWNEVLMYPAGYFSRDIPFDPTLTLPAGWKYATALESPDGTQSNTLDSNGTVHFAQTPLNQLVDSPLFAGVNFARYDLSPAPTDHVHLNVFGDTPEEVKMTPEELQLHKELAIQADKLYGSHHYKHYDFLLLLSDVVGGEGLEHHQSSEDGTDSDYLTDWKGGALERDLLAHEYTHSWNGKFRRPGDLWTPNFNVPMRDDLLWVYEGMTQYWGNVLTSRAGMRTPEQMRDIFAYIAANFAVSPGRDWRTVVDTTNQETVSHRRPVSWVSWQRPEDYYTEGMLVWLDADTKIRELTDGKKSLDDFCKRFFGVYNGSFITDQYDFDDVVSNLNAVVPFDWATFLRTRIYDLHPQVPMGGFTQGGWKLVYTDTPIEWLNKGLGKLGRTSFSTSLGITLGSGDGHGPAGSVSGVVWDSPAFKAGITPAMEVVAVNGMTYTPKVLTDAILEAEHSKKPIQLELHDADHYRSVSLPYYEGLRIPHLEREPGTPDRLDDILAPSKSPLPSM